MKFIVGLLVLFFQISGIVSQELPQTPAPAKLLSASSTVYDVAYWLDENSSFQKFGLIKTTSIPTSDGQGIKTVRESELSLSRGGKPFITRTNIQTTEQSGKLLALKYQLGMPAQFTKELQQTETGYEVRTTQGDTTYTDPIPEKALQGLATENELITQCRKVGDKFTYAYYEPSLNVSLKVQVEAIQLDSFQQPDGKIAKWLCVQTKSNPVANVQPPIGRIWLDPATGVIKQSMSEIPAIGTVMLVRTNETETRKPLGTLPDPQKVSDVRLRAVIPAPHTQKSLTYRFTLSLPANPADLLKADEYQTITPDKDGLSFLVKIENRTQGLVSQTPKEEPTAYLAANTYISSDDATVARLAKTASGTFHSDLQKAQNMEGWLRKNFRFHSSKSIDTATQTANDPNGLSGDCTEVAMLLCAMLRAEKIPSRTAIGLIYADDQNKPRFAFHMWAEANIDGRWHALDATLGLGSIGPAHIKVTDSSWAGERQGMYTPYLPVMNLIAKRPKIEVVPNR
jgi:transglutaminase-like putative cysteine protease